LFAVHGPVWTPSPRLGSVTALAASTGALFVGTSSGTITRLNVASGEYEEFEFPPTQRSLPPHALFADPNSALALIAVLPSAENHYYFKGKQRQLAKLKGVRITAVSWLKIDPMKPDVREMVIGDAAGILYEAVIEPSRTRSFRQLHLLSPPSPVYGLHCEIFPSISGHDTQIVVIAATLERQHEFLGGPTLEDLFSKQEDTGDASITRKAVPTTSTSRSTSNLAIYPSSKGAVKTFACICAGQLVHGTVHDVSKLPSIVIESAAEPLSHLGLPRIELDLVGHDPVGLLAKTSIPPISVALTEFHYVLLHHSCVYAISRFNHKVVCRSIPPRAWPTGTLLRGLVQDATKGAIWAWGDAGLLRVRVAHEERHVWRLYLEATNFAAALSYCSPMETLQRDAVLTVQAHHVFDEGDFESAATLFAKTKVPIEDVAMRFIVAQQCRALRTFLLHKLDCVEEVDIAQLTIMCTWLTDIYLHTLAAAAEPATHAAVARDLRVFFFDKRQRLHRPTTQSQLDVQGCTDEALYFANICDDCERAVSLRMQQRCPEEGLCILSVILNGVTHHNEAETESEVVSLLEKISSQLMLLAPEQLIDVWMCARTIDPVVLLPAMMSYELRSGQGIEAHLVLSGTDVELQDRCPDIARRPTVPWHQGIRCLQHCSGVLRCERPEVLNYLTLLHAKHSPDAQLFLSLSGLRAAHFDGAVTLQAAGGVGALALTPLQLPCDPQYAIKLCLESGRTAGCVVIYQRCGMGLEAVELALSQRRTDLARQSADAVHPDWLRKVLWLRVAGWAVDAKGCALSAQELELHECQASRILKLITESCSQDGKPLLQVENLLELFPAVTMIKDVYQPLVASLLGYGQATEGAHNEIFETADAAMKLRDEIGFLEMRPIGACVERCCDCSELVSINITVHCDHTITSTYITYPCHHSFRAECLGRAARLSKIFCSDDVASECPLCGEQMVGQVSSSFMETDNERYWCTWPVTAVRG